MGSIHKFLKSINYEDTNGDFEEASISCVKVNKKKDSFEVFISNDKQKCDVNYVYDEY